jgi:hypothetical protein
MPVKTWLVRVAAAAVGLAFAGNAMAMSLMVSEIDIRSLANAPAVRAAEGSIDNAARPAIFLELEFANDCLARTGASLRLLSGSEEGPAPALIVGQRVPPDGCPDIFQPVRTTVLALLPLDLRGSDVTLIGRPASAEVATRVTLEAEGKPPTAGTILEVSPEAGVFLPRVDGAMAEPGLAGYRLSGRLLVASACVDADIKAEVLEIPDTEGDPTSDVVLIIAPTSCRPPGAVDAQAVSIDVRTPQPTGGRRVLWVNARAQPLTLVP